MTQAITRKQSPTGHKGLIATKLSAFVPNSPGVLRSELLKQIEGDLSQHRLVEIIAAAGSGKSFLMGQLYQLARDQGRQTCWVSLDESDNDPGSFLIYLVAALRRMHPGLAERADQMLDAGYARDPEPVFQSICEDLSGFDQPAHIFLDDFQHISDPGIVAGMQAVLKALPETVCLVIASRTHLPFKLSALKLESRLISFEQSDLQFSPNETKEILNQVNHLSLGDTHLTALRETTEGWAAGLQLAAIALRNQPDRQDDLIREFGGSSQALSTYLMERVFELQDEDIKDFLLKTAPLTRMSAALCDAVTGRGQASAYLQRIQALNLFVIPLDEAGSWVRYHHLFAEFLINLVKQKDPDQFTETCKTASEWCLGEASFTEAVQYLLLAEDYEDAAHLIAREGGQVAQYLGDHRTILDWMRRLPKRYHTHHPLIMLNHAWSLTFSQSADEGRSLAQAAQRGLDNPGLYNWDFSPQMIEQARRLSDVIVAISYASGDLTEEAIQSGEQALSALQGESAFFRGSLCNVLAYASISTLEFDKGLEFAAQARMAGLEANAAYVIAWSDWISACINIKLGLLRDAELHLSRGRSSVEKLTRSRSHARTLLSVLEAEILCERGALVEAEASLGERSVYTSVLGSMQPLLSFQRTQARLLASRGDDEQALAALKSGQEEGLTSGTPRIAIFLAAEEIRILLARGLVEKAKSVARRWGFSGGANIFGVDSDDAVTRQTADLMHARLLIAQGEYKSAMTIIVDQISLARKFNRGRALVELTVLRAHVLWKLDRNNEALRTLAQATALAVTEAIAWPFIELREHIADMFEALIEQRGAGDVGHLKETVAFERHLFAMMYGKEAQPEKDADTADDTVIETLTDRETEILDLVAGGLSNADIADSLLVSLPTIKWHMKNIFSKLDVRNRTAAVARAKELNLIP